MLIFLLLWLIFLQLNHKYLGFVKTWFGLIIWSHSFFVNSYLAFRFLLLIIDLPCYTPHVSTQKVDCDNFTSALQKLLVMSLAADLNSFSHEKTEKLLFFLAVLIHFWLLVHHFLFFFRTFQIVILTMPNACAKSLIKINSFLNDLF